MTNKIQVVLAMDWSNGVFEITEEKEGPVKWSQDGGPNGDAKCAYFSHFDGEELVAMTHIDGGDWNALGMNGMLLDIPFWVNRGVGLVEAVNAAVQGVDPDGRNKEDELWKETTRSRSERMEKMLLGIRDEMAKLEIVANSYDNIAAKAHSIPRQLLREFIAKVYEETAEFLPQPSDFSTPQQDTPA